MTSVETAVTELHKAGYRANASNLYPGKVTVQDPVACSSGSRRWTEYQRRTIHPDDVWRFLEVRS